MPPSPPSTTAIPPHRHRAERRPSRRSRDHEGLAAAPVSSRHPARVARARRAGVAATSSERASATGDGRARVIGEAIATDSGVRRRLTVGRPVHHAADRDRMGRYRRAVWNRVVGADCYPLASAPRTKPSCAATARPRCSATGTAGTLRHSSRRDPRAGPARATAETIVSRCPPPDGEAETRASGTDCVRHAGPGTARRRVRGGFAAMVSCRTRCPPLGTTAFTWRVGTGSVRRRGTGAVHFLRQRHQRPHTGARPSSSTCAGRLQIDVYLVGRHHPPPGPSCRSPLRPPPHAGH